MPAMVYDYRTASAASVVGETNDALAAADALVGEALSSGSATFTLRVVPLELAVARVAEAYGRSAFLGYAHPDPDARQAGSEAEERLAKWRAALPFREDLYHAVQAAADDPAAADLAPDQRRVLDLWLRDFRRAGQALDPGSRSELESMRSRLVELEVAFSRNLNEHEDSIDATPDQLAGLPDDFIERLRPGTKPGTRRVSLDYPEVYPFLAQAADRSSREALFRKHWRRAMDANRPLLAEAIRLRQRAAELLGWPSWAHYRLETKMAERPEAVAAFYRDLVPRLEPVRDRELAALAAQAAADGLDGPLAAWDWMYYDEQVRRAEYGLDVNEVSEYLPLEACVEGMLALTAEVFGVEYRRLTEARAWHPDVVLYEVRDRSSGELVAHFYADWFPREGKYGHAAAFPLVVGHRRADGTYEQPVSAILSNFTPPSGDRPSLLTHDELETLFHEFGHILHMSLTRAEYARTSGGECETDFVEAPSQIMEHWTWDPEVLGRFARHYRTAAPMPAELLRQLIAARRVNIGLKTMVQVFYGQVDLAIHDGRAEPDFEEVLRQAYRHVGLPYPEGTFLLSGWGHPMSEYDAGYYGYLWAEVIGDDLFGRFAREGVTSPAVGAEYRRLILEPNGSRPAADMVRAFLGRDFTLDAWLRLKGLEPGG